MATYPGSQTKITLTHDREATGDLVSQFVTQVMSKEMQIARLEALLDGLASGARNGSVDVTIDDGNGVKASGTVVFSGINTANDTFTLNGVTMTAVASASVNNQWSVAASATAQATAFAAAVNASTTSLISGQVVAVASGSTVTMTSQVAQIWGNAVTTAKGTDAGSVMTVSGARLTGGLAPTNPTVAPTYKHGV